MGLLDVLQSASNAVAGNVAGPVDLLSFLLRKGGVPVPEDALGGSEWMKRKGLMRDVPKGAEQVVGETLGLLAPTAIAANAPKIARGLLQAQKNAAAPRMLHPETGAIGWLESNAAMKTPKPLTEAQFNRAYMAHKDLRGAREGKLEDNMKSIMEGGFRRGFNVNLLPPYSGGPPTSVVDKAYAPRAGDVMYLVPKEGQIKGGNGLLTKEGYKPEPFEVLRITEDFPSLYQEYLKAWNAANKP